MIIDKNLKLVWQLVQRMTDLPWSTLEIESVRLKCAMIATALDNMFANCCVYGFHFQPFLVTGGGIHLIASWPLTLYRDAALFNIGDRGQLRDLYVTLRDVM